MADDHPSPATEAARVVDAVAAQATDPSARPGAPPAPARSPEQSRAELAHARQRLETAWHTSDSGTEIPEEARLRPVKRAMMASLRPVTSHQVPFNRELVAAIDRLANVVEDVQARVDGGDSRVDDALKRVQAGIATVDVAGADVELEVAALRERVDEVAARLEAAETDLASQTRALTAARAREDLVLRTAREAVGGAPLAPLAQDVAVADAALVRRLAAAGRPPADALRAQARTVADVVADAAAAAPVLDLASDAGEWLDVWAERGFAASGVEDQPDLVDSLRARGHTVEEADPVTHLADRPAGSLGAVTAAVLADVVPLATLVDLVDAARESLRPGGVLVLAAADPAGQSTGDPQWADPRRRPLHAATLTLLALERGWAEADLVGLDPAAGASYVVVARTAGGPPLS
ncbi:hypothetical protein BH24ACT4_BH24ACT4_08280 [soil metagenome]